MKRKYNSPLLMTLTPGDDPIIPLGPSQGTSGDEPQYSWDPAIDPDYIDLFWANFDETDLAWMDTDGDYYISSDEFNAWYEENQPW